MARTTITRKGVAVIWGVAQYALLRALVCPMTSLPDCPGMRVGEYPNSGRRCGRGVTLVGLSLLDWPGSGLDITNMRVMLVESAKT